MPTTSGSKINNMSTKIRKLIHAQVSNKSVGKIGIGEMLQPGDCASAGADRHAISSNKTANATRIFFAKEEKVQNKNHTNVPFRINSRKIIQIIGTLCSGANV